MPVTRNDLEQTEKRSGAKVLLAFSFRKFVAQGVTVASIVSVTSTNKNIVPGSTNLVITGQAAIGNKVTAFFDSGTSGESYLVVATAVMTDGQTLPIAGIVNVLDRTQ